MRTRNVKKAYDAAEINTKWEKTAWAQKLANKALVSLLTRTFLMLSLKTLKAGVELLGVCIVSITRLILVQHCDLFNWTLSCVIVVSMVEPGYIGLKPVKLAPCGGN